MKQCVFYWGNAPAEGGGSFSLQAGIAPSSGVLRFTLGQSPLINQINTFRLTDFAGANANFSKCRITRTNVGQSSGAGRWYEVQFVDRRWMWGERCFAIYGEYNTNADNALHTGGLVAGAGSRFYRTTQQLAALCLDAMGELGYDISLLPNFPGPPTVWDAADPAVELQRLCESLGCMVTLSPLDRVVIVRDGFGRVPRPDSRQMDFTAATEPPVIPAALVFEGGRMHIQHDLYLVPVAEENDRESPNYGKYVSIYDLAYYAALPAYDWSTDDPLTFNGLWAASDAAVRDANTRHALNNVWRKYAVMTEIQLPVPPEDITTGTNGKKLTVTRQRQLSSYFKINAGEGWRTLPWNETQNSVSHRGSGQLPAAIYGYRWLGNAHNINTQAYTSLSSLPARTFDASKNIVPIGNPAVGFLQVPASAYRIDYEKGMVEFNEPCYFEDIVDLRQPAPLRIRTSFPIRDRFSGAFVCPQWWRTPGSPIATNLAKIVKRSDIFFEFDKEGNDNAASFKSSADYFLAAELNTYSIGTGYSAPYKGFVVDIPVDGVVRTVAWDTTPDSGGMTHIDYNMERPEAYLTLTEVHARRMATWNAFKAEDDKRKRDRGLKVNP